MSGGRENGDGLGWNNDRHTETTCLGVNPVRHILTRDSRRLAVDNACRRSGNPEGHRHSPSHGDFDWDTSRTDCPFCPSWASIALACAADSPVDRRKLLSSAQCHSFRLSSDRPLGVTRIDRLDPCDLWLARGLDSGCMGWKGGGAVRSGVPMILSSRRLCYDLQCTSQG